MIQGYSNIFSYIELYKHNSLLSLTGESGFTFTGSSFFSSAFEPNENPPKAGAAGLVVSEAPPPKAKLGLADPNTGTDSVFLSEPKNDGASGFFSARKPKDASADGLAAVAKPEKLLNAFFGAAASSPTFLRRAFFITRPFNSLAPAW